MPKVEPIDTTELTALELTAAERTTVRVALTRFKLELERPGMLGHERSAEALQEGHKCNVRSLLERLMRLQATDER